MKKLLSVVKSVSYRYWKDLLILFLGFIGYIIPIPSFFFLMCIHFVFRILCLNSAFSKRWARHKDDQRIIADHYKEDFKYLYYIFWFYKFFFMFSTYYIFCNFGAEEYKAYSDYMMYSLYLFWFVLLFDYLIKVYIIFYKNKRISDTLIGFLTNSATTLIAGTFTLHMYSFTAEPNFITNEYNWFSPVGRGYKCHSSIDVSDAQVLKYHMRHDFDPKTLIDDKGFLDREKMETAINRYGGTFKKLDPKDTFTGAIYKDLKFNSVDKEVPKK